MAKSTCSIEGCGKSHHSRGLCGMHAQRLKRNGDPLDPGTRIVGDDEARFWGYIDTSGDCWEWTGSKLDGYGRLTIDGRQQYAHRVAYRMLGLTVPEGMEIDHLCRNRACVNPDHLEPVPHRVNVLRGDAPSAHAARKTHCPEGHPYSGDNLYIQPSTGARVCVACRDLRDANRSRSRKAGAGA